MHLVMSDPVLRLLGIHYTDDDNGTSGKAASRNLRHFVVLLFLLLLRRGDPIGMLIRLYRSERIFTGFLVP